jgi:dTDP-4-dehydrorhamnose reductase
VTKRVSILVTGASGQVGVDLVDTLRAISVPGADKHWQPDDRPVSPDEFEVHARSHAQLDITSRESIANVLAELRPDVVVNLAAYTKVDAAESDPESCFALNRHAVGQLSELARESGAHLITVSTDYVFDGTKGAAYIETDSTAPLNVYGRSKRDGELLCTERDTIVRTSWVFGVRARNVVHLIADRVTQGQTVRFVSDQRGTATFAADLSRALVTFVRQRPGGVWHFANTGDLTWYELASEVAHTLTGSRELVEPIATSDLVPTPAAQRPSRSDLDTSKWRSQGFVAPPTWSVGLARLLIAK